MATTFELISSNILTGSQASVTFSAIPSTFSDLCLKVSVRDTSSTSYPNDLYVQANLITSYSRTRLWGYGSTVDSSRGSTSAFRLSYAVTSNSQTANTFASSELYIPNYANSTANKPASGVTGSPENGTTNPVDAIQAMLMLDNAAITSLTCTTANNFVSGSSFYLYGIKNS